MDAFSIFGMFPFYGEASADRQQQMVMASSTATLAAGSFYFRSGAQCSGVAFVGSGRVRVFKQNGAGRQISLYHVERGETCLLTLSSALTGDAYSADGVVDRKVTAVVVPVPDFRLWFDSDRVFRDYVLRTITNRMVDLMQLVEEVAFERVDRRLVHYLLKESRHSDGGVVRATHEEIATEVGISRETVSRVLKDFERQGLIELSRGSIRIGDPGGLRTTIHEP
ncbi:MAG: Crp/Fnr family transcriptional regulator [Acidimicrobiia bacterium]|nr:Crp/Fnr family transcriptional regulator [Acidimicrobiia bacterium]